MESYALHLGQAGALTNNRPFRRLWAAQFVATTAVYSLALAGIVLVEERGGSSAWTAAALICSILPAFLGSLVAGVVVDRIGRVPVLMACHLLRTILALAFWGVGTLLRPPLDLLTILAITAAIAFSTQFTITSELAFVPDLVDQERRMSANALLQMGMLAGEGLGVIVLAPLVIRLAGVPAVGLLGAVLCLLALAWVSGLPRAPSGATPAPGGEHTWTTLASDFRDGWGTMLGDRTLLLVAGELTLAATLLLMLASLLPGLVSRHLGLNSENATLLLVPGGVGFVLGSILVGRKGNPQTRLSWIGSGLVTFGVSVGLLGALGSQPERLVLLLPVILAAGLALALVIIPGRTILQERPPAEMRGRVISCQLVLAHAGSLLPLLLGGIAADQVGIRVVIGLMGLVAFATGIVGLGYARRESAR